MALIHMSTSTSHTMIAFSDEHTLHVARDFASSRSDEHTLHVARDFASSRLAEAWGLFGREIRIAILDSVVMHEMRIADSVGSEIRYTAMDLVAFRNRLQDVLARGAAPAGTRRPPIAFTIEALS